MSHLRDIGFRMIEYQYMISLCSSALLLIIPTHSSSALTIAPPFILLLVKSFRIIMVENRTFQVAIFLLMSASPISIAQSTLLLMKSLSIGLIQRIEDVTSMLMLSISIAQVLGIILLLIQVVQVHPFTKHTDP